MKLSEKILKVMIGAPEMTPGEIGRILGMHGSHIGGVLSRMVSSGQIKRREPGGYDKNRAKIKLFSINENYKFCNKVTQDEYRPIMSSIKLTSSKWVLGRSRA